MSTGTSSADLILVGANVLTLAPNHPPASCVAVADGKVIAIGGDDLVADLRGPKTEIADLQGATLTAGLVDSHMHPVMGTQMTDGVDLSACRNLDQVREALVQAEGRLGPDEWLTGWGLDPNVFGTATIGYETIGPVLDRRPSMLTIFDGHAAVVSREGLRRAGIDGPREFESRSTIVCDAQGQPTGHLLEAGALDLVHRAVPTAPFESRLERLAELFAQMAASGLTGGHVMDLNGDSLQLLEALDDTNRLPLRLRLAPWCRPDDGPAGQEEIRALQGRAGRLWRVSAVKMFMDGTIDGGTSWLHEPDCYGESTAAYWRNPDDYTAAVAFFASSGIQTATHAIGDAAVQHVLDSVQQLPSGVAKIRHRIEHIETLPSDQVARFAELDVIASMQPSHATDYTKADHSDNWSQRLGDERANHGWRCRDLLDAGATVALGSDWPIAPFDPRGIMAAARSRQPAGHPEVPPVVPSQALTPSQALAGFTLAPAYASGREADSGQVARGYRADLTVFEQDPTAVTVNDLPHLPVLMTVVDGHVRHRTM